MSRVFIGHSSANNVAALALSKWLEQEGWSDHFLDVDAERGIAPGQRWQAALAAAVDHCEAVIFLISPAWRDSRWCLAEFHQAKSLGKSIFGVLVEPVPFSTLPTEITSEWQLCNLVDGDERVQFSVGKPPVVLPATIDFATDGLKRLRIGLNRAGLDPSAFVWPPPQEPDRSPYPGLRALDAQDAAVFFGREASIVRAMDQLRLLRERGIERLFVILGASGSGKSSFLRAGLLPRLKRDTEHYVVLPVLRPERSALHGTYGLVSCLHGALLEAKAPLNRAEINAQLTGAVTFSALLERLDSASSLPSSTTGLTRVPAARTIVLPVDQGEELFMGDGATEARDLLGLIGAVNGKPQESRPSDADERPRLLVVLTIRSDSFKSVQTDPVLSRIATVLFSLPPMPAAEFKAVIEGPSRRQTEAGRRLRIHAELTELLMRDAKGADALPLLALTLEWLYREYGSVRDTAIGLKEYQALGGVRGAIQVAVQRALDRPQYPPVIPTESAEQQRVLRNKCFPALATVDPDTAEPKRLVATQDDLIADSPETLPFIDRLVEQHLLLRDRRQVAGHGETTVLEVAHEALLRHWDAMAQWLAEYGEALMTLEALRRAASEWERNDKDPGWLVHTAHRLAVAEALRNHVLKTRLAEADEQYLNAAREREVDQLQRQQDHLRKQEQQQREIAAQQSEIARQQEARTRLQRRTGWGLLAGICVLVAMGAGIVAQTRSVARQTSLVLTDAGNRADKEERFDRGLRFGVLAAKHSLLNPANPNAVFQLVRAAEGSSLRAQLGGHRDRVTTARFSPDGKRVVTASKDGTARIWDADTGQAMGAPLKHDDVVIFAEFSADGKRVVTASWDKTARIWDADTCQALGAPLTHNNSVISAQFSADGKRVVTASQDKTARIWDAGTGQALGAPLKHNNIVISAQFSPDGKRVVTASEDKTARIWDTDTGHALGAPLKHDDVVASAQFSADGKRVVTASEDKTARIWDVNTGQALGAPLKHDDVVISAEFSADGKRVVTASEDGTVRIWDAGTGQPLGAVLKHERRVYSAQFSPDGSRVVTASKDGTARLWDANIGQALGAAMKHEDGVISAQFSPDGRRVVTASDDKTARIWDVVTDRALGAPLKHDDVVISAEFSADGKRVVTASEDGTARIWDAVTGQPLGAALKHENAVYSAQFSLDGKRVVTASGDEARLWDANTGQAVGAAMKHEDGVISAKFSPDGKRVVTASEDGTARIWDAGTGQALGAPLKHDGVVASAQFSADGKRVVTASQDETVRIWDAGTGQALSAPLTHNNSVFSAQFSVDGKRVVTASQDGTARIWDADTGQALGTPLKHDDVVIFAEFSPDGKRVVTASLDKTARIWDADTGRALGAPLKHDDLVQSAQFSPDGKRVVSSSKDGTARLWDADTGHALGAPLKHERRVISAQFSPDGKRVVTASEDKTARIWDVSWHALAHSRDLLMQVCTRKLVGSLSAISPYDIVASPILAGREGEDVCAAIK